MGLYDTIEVKCLYCGKLTYPQTKVLGDNTLQTLKVGDRIDTDLFDNDGVIIRLKNNCEHCNKPLNLNIQQGMIEGLTKKTATIKETLYGDMIEVKK